MTRTHVSLPEFVADPLGALAKARTGGWLADFDLALGVVSHHDVRELLGDARLRSDFPDFLRTFGVSSGPFF